MCIRRGTGRVHTSEFSGFFVAVLHGVVWPCSWLVRVLCGKKKMFLVLRKFPTRVVISVVYC